MGVFALPILVMLAQAVPAAPVDTEKPAPPPLQVPAPDRPFYLEPVAVTEVTVIADEPWMVCTMSPVETPRPLSPREPRITAAKYPVPNTVPVESVVS